MQLEYFKRALSTAILVTALTLPVVAQQVPLSGQSSPPSSPASQTNQARFAQLVKTVEMARSMEKGNTSAARMAEVERELSDVLSHLDRYPTLGRVHGHEEPDWLNDRGDMTSMAILALAALERVSPSPARLEKIKQLSYGLTYLQRKERTEYPFAAHISWLDAAPFAELADGTEVPTAFYRTDRAYAVQALVEAGKLLGEARLTESAIREALGMSTHLVVHGDLIRSFSPQPEYSKDPNDALPLVEGFVELYQATDNPLYADLAALATRWNKPTGKLTGSRYDELRAILERSPAAELLKAEPVGDPVTFQYIEAEEGRVVNRAIDTLNYESSSHLPGKLAVMGRENTFWMRFDVPTEDDYLFDLSYLQSDVGGGLVSVMMRIDGDKIFQVPLGDVDGKPILRRAYVDGPRPLRAGPHSFGIRFSGLLMTKPALLDSVVVQPALERREFRLPSGEHLYLVRNVTGQAARTDRDHFVSWPPSQQIVVDGQGQEAKLGSAEDRRRRKSYVTLPPYGVAVLRMAPASTVKE